MTSKYSIIGIGGPILDQVLKVSDDYLSKVPGKKGGMEPVDHLTLQGIIAGSGGLPVITLGGCSRNIMHGMTKFGDRCAMLGMVGRDPMGQTYRRLLEGQGIHPLLMESPTETAIVLSLVTPDGERTMRTFQGASKEFRGAHLDAKLFEGVRLVHVEGYALFNDDLVETAMQIAQDAGAKISFDLASFEVVGRYKEKILYLLDEFVDIAFCNEVEAAALTGLDESSACDFLAERTEIGVVLMGEKGCFVRRGSKKVHCPAYPIVPVDTTGAGDLFASGFLHAYLQGYPLEICGHYGAIAGRAVVQVMGAEIPHSGWVEIFKTLKKREH